MDIYASMRPTNVNPCLKEILCSFRKPANDFNHFDVLQVGTTPLTLACSPSLVPLSWCVARTPFNAIGMYRK